MCPGGAQEPPPTLDRGSHTPKGRIEHGGGEGEGEIIVAGRSETYCVWRVAAAVPHTPRPKAMVWQATLPWKGPRIRDGCGEAGSRT